MVAMHTQMEFINAYEVYGGISKHTYALPIVILHAI